MSYLRKILSGVYLFVAGQTNGELSFRELSSGKCWSGKFQVEELSGYNLKQTSRVPNLKLKFYKANKEVLGLPRKYAIILCKEL